ncbi:SSS family transporter [Tamaricihabitans halophyticus]|uniref:SSS family transporter n=1 Tax=Tamaricihabitans halophyticus TaxID=1262583 RepID=A0A4R2QFN3_9PSEU|nr:sodium:solute symporter family protein [Tamaricihabitans halophyticus]TCP47324.1 SSS family transporter [Tamaricihabitans halophyticus]
MTLTMVLAYFAVTVLIGWIARRRVRRSTDEYFIAGRSVGTFANSWAFLATMASGGTIMASVGMTLFLGLPYTVSLAAGAPVGFAIASILVARPMRRVGQYTVPDFFNVRFANPVIRWASPIVILIASTVYMVAQLTGSGIIATVLLGWSHETGVIITGVIFVLYTSLGGFLSVTWNDVLQGILMVVMTVAFGVIAVFSVVNFADTFSRAAEQYPSYGMMGGGLPFWSYIGGFVTSAATICVLPHVIMRVYSARNTRSARLSLNYAMILYGVIVLSTALVLAPVATTLSNVEELKPDAIFFALSGNILPPFLQGLLAAAVLAAVMSTTAGLLMACNSAISNDLYARLLRPGASSSQVVRVATLSTWLVGVVAILLALNPPDFLVVLYVAAVGFLASAFFAPMILGIWWRRCTSRGAAAGLLGGVLSFAVAYFFFELPDSTEILIGIPVSFAATIAVSLTGSGPSAEQRALMESAHSSAEHPSPG